MDTFLSGSMSPPTVPPSPPWIVHDHLEANTQKLLAAQSMSPATEPLAVSQCLSPHPAQLLSAIVGTTEDEAIMKPGSSSGT